MLFSRYVTGSIKRLHINVIIPRLLLSLWGLSAAGKSENTICRVSGQTASNGPVWNPTGRKSFFSRMRSVSECQKWALEIFACSGKKMSQSAYFQCTIIFNQGWMGSPCKCTGRTKYCRRCMTPCLLLFRQPLQCNECENGAAALMGTLVTLEWFEHLGRVNHMVPSNDGRFTWSWVKGTKCSSCSVIPSSPAATVWRLPATFMAYLNTVNGEAWLMLLRRCRVQWRRYVVAGRAAPKNPETSCWRECQELWLIHSGCPFRFSHKIYCDDRCDFRKYRSRFTHRGSLLGEPVWSIHSFLTWTGSEVRQIVYPCSVMQYLIMECINMHCEALSSRGMLELSPTYIISNIYIGLHCCSVLLFNISEGFLFSLCDQKTHQGIQH